MKSSGDYSDRHAASEPVSLQFSIEAVLDIKNLLNLVKTYTFYQFQERLFKKFLCGGGSFTLHQFQHRLAECGGRWRDADAGEW